MRRSAKVVNFGVLYGMGSGRLAARCKIPRGEAAQFIENYFTTYSKVEEYMTATVDKGRSLGYVQTLSGRRRYLPDLLSDNRMMKENAERIAANTPIQGSAADLIKIAMIRIRNELASGSLRCDMLLQVHDELVFEVDKRDVDAAIAMIKTGDGRGHGAGGAPGGGVRHRSQLARGAQLNGTPVPAARHSLLNFPEVVPKQMADHFRFPPDVPFRLRPTGHGEHYEANPAHPPTARDVRVSRLILGVTGNIASGKSETARLLQQKGCALVDADAVAHELYGYDRALVQQLGAEFGQDIIWSNGTLDRKRLGSLVFGRPEAMAALNRIVHPALINAIRERIRSSQRVMNRLVLDAALIVELGFAKEVDYLVFVSASVPVRLARLMERSGLTTDEAMRRIDSQMPEESKLQHADFVIKNETTKEYLAEQVDALWDEILARETQAAEPLE